MLSKLSNLTSGKAQKVYNSLLDDISPDCTTLGTLQSSHPANSETSEADLKTPLQCFGLFSQPFPYPAGNADEQKALQCGSAGVGKRRHDNLFFSKHLLEAPPFSVLVADRAYDSNKNFRAVWKLGAVAMIPLRKNRKGLTAKRASREFDEKIYHQRSLVETAFSSIKRRFGSELLSVSYANQRKELLLKCLCYNIFVLIWTFSTKPETGKTL